MNIDAPAHDFHVLFQKIEESLLAKRCETVEKAEIKIDPEDLKLTLSKTVGIIIEMCKVSDSFNHSVNSVFLVHLNLLRNFCELALLEKGHRDASSLKSILHTVVHGSKFFDAILSIHLATPTALFTVAETLAFYFCALSSLTSLKCYVMRLCECLDENPIFVLKVVEQLCVQCDTYPCVPFLEYLSVENGFLHKIVRLKPFIKDSIAVQLLAYRVLSKVLSPKLCPEGRGFLLKNISLLIGQYQIMPRNPLTSEGFWNLLNESIPLPCDTEVPPSVVHPACNTLLTTFMCDSDHTPTPQRKRSFGVCERGANDGGVSDKTGLCNLNLFLKCINWLFSSSSGDSVELDFIRQNLAHWNELLTRSLSVVESSDENEVTDLGNSLIGLFLDQDDELIIQLLLQLEIYHSLKKWLPGKSTTEFGIANPHSLFLELISILSHDSSILLDWLISNETRFLLYFLRYLKFANRSWPELSAVCGEVDKNAVDDQLKGLSPLNNVTITSLMQTLSQLKASILKLRSSNLFPYSPGALLKHVESLESKWKASNET